MRQYILILKKILSKNIIYHNNRRKFLLMLCVANIYQTICNKKIDIEFCNFLIENSKEMEENLKKLGLSIKNKSTFIVIYMHYFLKNLSFYNLL